jgi:hypothetical protein
VSDLLTLSELKGPVTDPPKPILPVGGRPTKVTVVSAAWLIKKAEPGDKLVFRTLDDLRFTTSLSSVPRDARFAVYLGDKEDDHPAFLALTDLTKGAGTKGPYRLDSAITKLTKKLVIAGHTLGLEIVAASGAIMVSSRIKQSAGRSHRKQGKKSKSAGAR